MFLLREIPDSDCLRKLTERYPDLDHGSVIAIMTFLRTADDLVDAFERFLAQHGLSQGRFAILAFLNREPNVAVNQTHLADACGVTKATITGLIDGLERDLLVERLPDPADRRASLVRLTKSGCEFLDALLPHHFKRTAEVFAGFSAEDRQALIQMMAKIRAGMQHVAELEKAGTLCNAPHLCCRRPVPPPS
jgi:DNA-binding MarR family transcriptional regulator